MTWYDKFFNHDESKYFDPPRPLTSNDIHSWMEAKTEGPPRGADEVRKRIRQANPVRWAHLQKEFAWAQKQAKKLGVNPEDVRWLL